MRTTKHCLRDIYITPVHFTKLIATNNNNLTGEIQKMARDIVKNIKAEYWL